MQKQNPLKYGLNLTTKKPSKPAPARSSVFGAADDDGDDDDAATATGDGRVKVNKQLTSYTSFNNKKVQEQHAEALEEDPTVFDYDAVYDDLKRAERTKKEEVKGKASEVKKPKYIEGLLHMAEVRKRDRLRAEERKIQREREEEGDEFEDKEKFVTEAYKQQQEELKRLEEEEKKKEANENPANGKALTGFYRTLLDTSTATHDAAVQAAKRSKSGDVTDANADVPAVDTRQDTDLAEAARHAGRNVVLNDDNQIVDKRQLLSAGLNIIAKPKSASGTGRSRGDEREKEYAAYQRRKMEEEAERRRKSRGDQKSRERLSKEVERQMMEKEEKEREEERKKEEETRKKLVKRTTEEVKMDAKARYLARKKQKLDD